MTGCLPGTLITVIPITPTIITIQAVTITLTIRTITTTPITIHTIIIIHITGPPIGTTIDAGIVNP
jgi:hypothetical protein